MKVRIHWNTHNGDDHGTDSMIISGTDIEDVKAKVTQECARRGLTEYNNNLWSEVIEE